MSADDDDKTSALIAQMLMQDQMQDAYENPYLGTEMGEEDLDDDFVPIKVLKNAKRRLAASQPPNKSTPASTNSSEENPSKKQRKKREAKEKRNMDDGFSHGKWTDEEEKLFLESLDLHGRDWKKASEFIKTRDKYAIASHAQKHFIKLWKEGAPLPAKVQETGVGYTLSGKPLDPNSGAARQYLGLKREEDKAKKNGRIDCPCS